MTPEQIERVSAVIARVDTSALAHAFYDRLFAADPDIAPMFGEPEAQEAKLRDELAAMVTLLGDLPVLDERARELGTRHRGYGVRAAHYREARQAMLDALDDLLGDDFDAEDRAAWDRATSLITELMQQP